MVKGLGLEPTTHGLKGLLPVYIISTFSLSFQKLTSTRCICFRLSQSPLPGRPPDTPGTKTCQSS